LQVRDDELFAQVEAAVGVRAVSARALSGGCIAEVHQVRLADGRDVVAKRAPNGNGPLVVEGAMLRYLRANSALPVPEVIAASDTLLVMTWLPGASVFGPEAEAHAAELLAALHGVHGRAHGFERATLIGGLNQPNAWADSWVDFFVRKRLLHMAGEALRARRLTQDLHGRLAAFARRAHEFLVEPEAPSLLHGDVWTTNVLADGGKITGFLDPAIYYGHPEIELAFITLFDTFGDTFFKRYHEIRPIQPGFFEQRREIYNLYPLLVHVRLFGSGYVPPIAQTLARLGF